MTTPSKDYIVRIAAKAHAKGYHSGPPVEGSQFFTPTQLQHFAALIGADLVAENERLSKLLRIEKIASDNCSHKDEADKLRTALAAAEAREEKLRAAIVMFRCEKAVCRADSVRKTKGYASMQEAVFDQPRDDSALREMIAGVYEECANVTDNVPIRVGNAGIWGVEVKNAIRALAEKKLASLTS